MMVLGAVTVLVGIRRLDSVIFGRNWWWSSWAWIKEVGIILECNGISHYSLAYINYDIVRNYGLG